MSTEFRKKSFNVNGRPQLKDIINIIMLQYTIVVDLMIQVFVVTEDIFKSPETSCKNKIAFKGDELHRIYTKVNDDDDDDEKWYIYVKHRNITRKNLLWSRSKAEIFKHAKPAYSYIQRYNVNKIGRFSTDDSYCFYVPIIPDDEGSDGFWFPTEYYNTVISPQLDSIKRSIDDGIINRYVLANDKKGDDDEKETVQPEYNTEVNYKVCLQGLDGFYPIDVVR